MARGQTWSEEETKALIQVWTDEHVSQLLVTTHKNNEVYKLMCLKMEKMGFARTVEQCRNKVKKLRQQYIKTRDVLRTSGTSGDAKDKFPWYDELDAVLGMSSPQHVVESHQAEAPPTSTLTPSDSESTEQDSEKTDKSATTSSLLDEERGQPRPAVPGAQKRKKKTKADRFEKLLESYLDDQRQRDEDERKRMKQESASFENFFKMQQRAEERHFQLMQEQQRANSQMFLQTMSTFLRAAVQQSVTPSTTPLQPTAASHQPSAHSPPA